MALKQLKAICVISSCSNQPNTRKNTFGSTHHMGRPSEFGKYGNHISEHLSIIKDQQSLFLSETTRNSEAS